MPDSNAPASGANQAPGDGMCQETSGFLFSHQCDRFAVQPCVRCGKWVCGDHNHEGPDGAICTTCAKREPPPAADPQAAEQLPPGDPSDPQRRAAAARGAARPYRDDPYFYGPYWYPGYGYYGGSRYRSSRTSDTSGTSGAGNDPHDFTEGDAGSLRQEEDGSFETDLGES